MLHGVVGAGHVWALDKFGWSYPDWVEPSGTTDTYHPGQVISLDRPTILPTPAPGIVDLSDALGVAGQSHVWIVYKGVNFIWMLDLAHGTNMSCVASPIPGSYWADKYHGQCPSGQFPTGPHQSGFWIPCLYTVPATVLPSGPPPDPSVVPAVGPLVQTQVQALTRGGAIASAPANKAYVNAPACFWLNGADTTTTTVEMRMDDPADDGEGRHIVYTYRLNIGYAGTTWNYGDGTTVEGDGGQPWSSAQPDSCSNPHSYKRISTMDAPGAVACPAGYQHASRDDGCYLITAVSHYTVSGDVFWWDSNGPEHQPINLAALRRFDLPGPGQPPNQLAVQVFQIEGIPVSP